MRCFETIKTLNSHFYHLDYHSFRLNQTRKQLFGIDKDLDLKNILPIQKKSGLFRCKVIYSKEIEQIEFFEYKMREFKSFKFINIEFDYRFKFLDRADIESINRDGVDEVIFVKNGLITDTSISNIAILKNKEWLTPKKPLLNGTTIERFKFLKKRDLEPIDLIKAEKVALLNAMMGFKILDSKLHFKF